MANLTKYDPGLMMTGRSKLVCFGSQILIGDVDVEQNVLPVCFSDICIGSAHCYPEL